MLSVRRPLLMFVVVIVGLLSFGRVQPAQASISPITYDLTPVVCANGAVITGTITTDGAMGALSSSDILAASYAGVGGASWPPPGPPPQWNSGAFSASGLFATATALTVDPSNFSYFQQAYNEFPNLSPPTNLTVGPWLSPTGTVLGVEYLAVSWDFGDTSAYEPVPAGENYVFAAVPEPSLAAIFLGMAVLGLGGFLVRRRVAKSCGMKKTTPASLPGR